MYVISGLLSIFDAILENVYFNQFLMLGSKVENTKTSIRSTTTYFDLSSAISAIFQPPFPQYFQSILLVDIMNAFATSKMYIFPPFFEQANKNAFACFAPVALV